MDQIPLQLDREGIKEREDLEIGVLGGGGNYSRKVIFSNISIKGVQLKGDKYSREAMNRGTAVI